MLFVFTYILLLRTLGIDVLHFTLFIGMYNNSFFFNTLQLFLYLNQLFLELLKHGIGCYHAGMNFHERSYVENLFRIGNLDILVATSTLGIFRHKHI